MADSGDIWAAGWVEEPRAVLRSDLYRSLTHPQREVLHALYRLANYRPGRLASGVVVEPGQIGYSLKRIAEEARTSIKVVRTTLRHLAEGSERDGIGPLVDIPAGTHQGTRTRLISMRHYPRSRGAAAETGTGTGTPGARSGHARGTDRRKGTQERRNNLPPYPPRRRGGAERQEADRLRAYVVAELSSAGTNLLDGDEAALLALVALEPRPGEVARRMRAAKASAGDPSIRPAALVERWDALAAAGDSA